jgi:hypothetical protein
MGGWGRVFEPPALFDWGRRFADPSRRVDGDAHRHETRFARQNPWQSVSREDTIGTTRPEQRQTTAVISCRFSRRVTRRVGVFAGTLPSTPGRIAATAKIPRP